MPLRGATGLLRRLLPPRNDTLLFAVASPLCHCEERHQGATKQSRFNLSIAFHFAVASPLSLRGATSRSDAAIPLSVATTTGLLRRLLPPRNDKQECVIASDWKERGNPVH